MSMGAASPYCLSCDCAAFSGQVETAAFRTRGRAEAGVGAPYDRETRSLQATKTAAVLLSLLLMGGAARATLIYATEFESPNYSPGLLEGQDGWIETHSTAHSDFGLVQALTFHTGAQAVQYDSIQIIGGQHLARHAVAYNSVTSPDPIVRIRQWMFLEASRVLLRIPAASGTADEVLHFDTLEWIHRITTQIPDPRYHLVRYAGAWCYTPEVPYRRGLLHPDQLRCSNSPTHQG